VPLGVYDHPPGPEDTGIRAVQIPDTLGPFRLKEYGRGFAALTKLRDGLVEALGDLVP
jgi:hypothetical protein